MHAFLETPPFNANAYLIYNNNTEIAGRMECENQMKLEQHLKLRSMILHYVSEFLKTCKSLGDFSWSVLADDWIDYCSVLDQTWKDKQLLLTIGWSHLNGVYVYK